MSPQAEGGAPVGKAWLKEATKRRETTALHIILLEQPVTVRGHLRLVPFFYTPRWQY
jgi:hypothetical protein